MTFDDTPKEAKLHEGSVLLDASSRFLFLTLSSNAKPKRRMVATSATPPARVICPFLGLGKAQSAERR